MLGNHCINFYGFFLFCCFLRSLALKTLDLFVPNLAWAPRAWILLCWQAAGLAGLFSGCCQSCW